MKRCFDWNKNILKISDMSGNEFELKFKDLKTIVNGDSATGKTLLCSIIRSYMDDMNDDLNKVYDTSNIVLLDKNNMQYIKNMKDKLIIIDRADIILDKDTVEAINIDWGINKYLIFSRKPLGINLSPNYYAIFENTSRENGNIVRLKYLCNIGGWN